MKVLPQSHKTLISKLARYRRVHIHRRWTEIEHLKNLSAMTGDNASLYIKRDDTNGLAFGGNKLRQLEWYIGDARASGADTVLITGAVQSNFTRLTAACCCRFNLECHIQLESRVESPSELYLSSGNVLLNRLFGAHLHYFPEGENEKGADYALQLLAEQLRKSGRNPYIIPLAAGNPPLGALGYVDAAMEILQQIQSMNLDIDKIFVASGSGATHSGLLYGLRAIDDHTEVVGVCVRRGAKLQSQRIREKCEGIEQLLQLGVKIHERDIAVTDEHFLPGYGQASGPVWQAMESAARSEGIILDPTYTGKTMAAFIDHARCAPQGANYMFIHTGGTPGLFAYQDQLQNYLDNSRRNSV